MTDVIRNSSCPKVLPRRTLILMATATLTACATSPPDLQLSDDERNEVTQIGQYLNGLNSFQANFFQTGAFGDGTGTVWLDRPGRLRMDYAGSNAKTVVANNGRLVVFDGATGGTTTMPVSRTPLGMLLTPSIRLRGAVTVTAYRHGAGLCELTIKKTDAPNQGTLTLYLSPSPLTLREVLLTDAYERTLVMRLSNMHLNPPLTSDLFQL